MWFGVHSPILSAQGDKVGHWTASFRVDGTRVVDAPIRVGYVSPGVPSRNLRLPTRLVQRFVIADGSPHIVVSFLNVAWDDLETSAPSL
jgi:hypothetical protein